MREENVTQEDGRAVRSGTKQRTISRQVILSLLGAVSAAFVLALALIFALFTWRTIQDTLQEMENVAAFYVNTMNEIGDWLVIYPKDFVSDVTRLSTELHYDIYSREALDRITQWLYESQSNYGDRAEFSEISVVDSGGEIIASTDPDKIGWHMDSAPETRAFYENLKENGSYCQEDFGPSFTDPDASVLYFGAVSESGVAVYYCMDRTAYRTYFEWLYSPTFTYSTIGISGIFVMCDKDKNIIGSTSDLYNGSVMDAPVFAFDVNEVEPLKMFRAKWDGADCYVITGWDHKNEYCTTGIIPLEEVFADRNATVGAMFLVMLVVLGSAFALLAVLMRRTIVEGVVRIAASLGRIMDGNQEERVVVRTAAEFCSLSDGINATVDTLKRMKAEAAARIDAELAYAKQIQFSALPSVFPPFPKRTEFDLYARMDTAKEVGGDFYDFYLLDGERLAFLIADVSGKGIPAALFMMRAKTMIKNLAEENHPVNEILTMANRRLCEGNDAGMFVTVWMCILNYQTGEAEYANAGHNQPVLRRKDGTFEYLTTRPGFVLAGLKQVRYRKNPLTFQPGDEIYLYTDGVTEANNAEEAMFGEERLAASLNSVPDEDARLLCDRVKADVDGFVGDAPQFDDITMVCLRYLGQAEAGTAEA